MLEFIAALAFVCGWVALLLALLGIVLVLGAEMFESL